MSSSAITKLIIGAVICVIGLGLLVADYSLGWVFVVTGFTVVIFGPMSEL